MRCVAWLGLLGALAAATAAPPRYPCFRAAVAPVVDGTVAGDPGWQGIPAATGFAVLGGTFTLAKQTTAQLCYTAEALFLAVTAEEPDAAAMVLKVRDGGPFWEDDGIEFFLRTGPATPVLQFGITAGGARGSAEGAPDFTRFTAAAQRGPDSYGLEVAIPWTVIGARPREGEAWTANVCRNIWTVKSGGDRFTSWAPLQRQFNEPEHFAVLELRGAAPDEAGAAALTAQLNAAWRADLTRRLTAVLRQGGEYVPTLTRAAADPRYAAKAQPLLDQWREAERLLATAAKVDLGELRRLLTGGDALVSTSYDVMYAYLIATVLPD